MPDPTSRDPGDELVRRVQSLANSIVDVLERIAALHKRVDELGRASVALRHTFRDVFGRLDRIETELQIDEPARPTP